jgi:hypothetical protein
MEKTYTYTKKQVLEMLDATPAEIEKLVKAGTLTRQRKTPDNNRSAWLYSAEELDTYMFIGNCDTEGSCCQEDVTTSTPKKKWYLFWK